MTLRPLARIQVPAPDFAEPTMYVRTDGGLTDEGVRLSTGQSVTFDTAFGVFAAGRWSRLTSVRDLTATMNVAGRCRIDLVAYANGLDAVVDSTETGCAVTCADMRSVGAE